MIDTGLLSSLRGGLIVSCQALPGEPLHGSDIMACMARAADAGGAVGIRANGPDDIRAIRKITRLPIIGLYKDGSEGVYITPTVEHARRIAEAGADIIAIDGTNRPRPDRNSLAGMISHIHQQLGRLVMADVSTLEEGLLAESVGADIVATTLSGYTPYSTAGPAPDLDLVKGLASRLSCPVIAEGRIRTPAEARAALAAGACAVVAGGAITRPQWITEQFVEAIKSGAAARQISHND